MIIDSLRTNSILGAFYISAALTLSGAYVHAAPADFDAISLRISPPAEGSLRLDDSTFGYRLVLLIDAAPIDASPSAQTVSVFESSHPGDPLKFVAADSGPVDARALAPLAASGPKALRLAASAKSYVEAQAGAWKDVLLFGDFDIWLGVLERAPEGAAKRTIEGTKRAFARLEDSFGRRLFLAAKSAGQGPAVALSDERRLRVEHGRTLDPKHPEHFEQENRDLEAKAAKDPLQTVTQGSLVLAVIVDGRSFDVQGARKNGQNLIALLADKAR